MTRPELKAWYEELEMTSYADWVRVWREQQTEKLYSVDLFWSLYSLRTDAHNYNELLLDGLERLLGINDRNFLPRVWGKEKNGIGTYAEILIQGEKPKKRCDFLKKM